MKRISYMGKVLRNIEKHSAIPGSQLLKSTISNESLKLRILRMFLHYDFLILGIPDKYELLERSVNEKIVL